MARVVPSITDLKARLRRSLGGMKAGGRVSPTNREREVARADSAAGRPTRDARERGLVPSPDRQIPRDVLRPAGSIPDHRFLGGPRRDFERVGRDQLEVLLDHGLTTRSYVIDIGCGVLRAGRWLIPYLDPGCYFGIEPNEELLSAGIKALQPGVLDEKRPHFDTNDRFDVGVFGARFTHFLLRSIWTHASKAEIETMLESFKRWREQGAVMLTSFLPADDERPDYTGERWTPRTIAHSRGWIFAACRERGLTVDMVPRPKINNQYWLRII